MKSNKMEYYDSHEQVKALIESGIKTQQAGAIVKTLQVTRSTDFYNLATKDQLNLVEERLNSKIDKVASDVVIKMLFWIIPMFVAIMISVFLR